MKARHLLLLALGAALLPAAALRGQGRDNRWDTGVSGNGALGQAITLAGGGSFDVPPASAPTEVSSSDSSSDSGSGSGSHEYSGSYGGGYSLGGGLIGGRGTSRLFGPGDDDARWDFAEERVDGIHGLWYGIRGIGRGIGSIGEWIGDGIGSLFESRNFRAKSGRIDFGPTWDSETLEVWGRRGKGYGIHSNRKKWQVRPFYDNIRLVALHGAVAKFKGYWGMIDPLNGKKLEDFDFVYDKYSGLYYPDGPCYFVCAFGQTSPNGMENWILAIPDGEGGYYRSPEEYAHVEVFADGGRYVRAVCKDHNGRYSLRGGDGREILGADYSLLRPSGMVSGTPGQDGVAHYEIRTADEGKYGIADSNGQFVVSPMYEEVSSWKQYGYCCRFDFGDWKGYNLIGLDGEEILTGMQSISYDSWYDSHSGELKIFLRVTDADGVNWICNTDGEGLISDVPDGFSPSMLDSDEQALLGSYLEKYTIY